MEKENLMNILLIPLCLTCIFLCFFYIRLRMEIRSLTAQLREIQSGSHMELAVNSRQKPLLIFCSLLNQVLTAKDANHTQYEKSEKLLKQNITSLAHDIRTPLTGASGYVQLALECAEGAASAKEAHYLHAAQKRLTELKDMLEEMFLYTKLTSEEFTLTIEKIQVLPLLSDCLLSLYTRFEASGTSPHVTFASETFSVLAEEEALRRIFLNLIQNALIHGTDGISILQEGSELIFMNSMPPDDTPDPEQIFDRFYKADSARRKGSSGLGLFIVKELTHKMNGEVKAEVEKGNLKIVLHFPSP